ncbi:MAG: peptidylprolyl isomerase [Pseudomonadota bacterium]
MKKNYWVVVCCLLTATWIPAQANEPQILDRVAAIVNDDVVLLSELDTRVNFIRKQWLQKRQGGELPPQSELRKSILDQLILEQLQLQMAQRAGLTIDDTELTQTLESVSERQGLNLSQWRSQLEKSGTSYNLVREQIRNEMLFARLQKRALQERIQITPQEVDQSLSAAIESGTTQGEFQVSHILLAIPEEAKDADWQALEKQAEDIYQQLQKNPEQFAELAKTFSSTKTAERGGDIGWRRAEELPSVFAEQALLLKVGEVAKPIRADSGFHIVQLMKVRGIEKNLVTETQVQHILIKSNEIRSNEESKTLIYDIHRKLKKGADFSTLANIYSDDPISARKGGDLGWVMPGMTVPVFERTMKKTPVGGLSDPFESEFGWHVLEVITRRTEDRSHELRRQAAEERLREQKFAEERESWLLELKRGAYIEIKI